MDNQLPSQPSAETNQPASLSSTFSKPRGLPRGLASLFFSRESIQHRFGAGSILREKKVLDLLSQKLIILPGALIILLLVIVISLVANQKTRLGKTGLSGSANPAEVIRKEGEKATYSSTYLNKTVTVNNAPEFMAFPSSFTINNNQANGVAVKAIDNSHFILESGKLSLAVAVVSNTVFKFFVHKPGQPVASEKDFTVSQLKGNHGSNIAQFDFLTVSFIKLPADQLPKTVQTNSPQANWQKDNEGNYVAQIITLYEKR